LGRFEKQAFVKPSRSLAYLSEFECELPDSVSPLDHIPGTALYLQDSSSGVFPLKTLRNRLEDAEKPVRGPFEQVASVQAILCIFAVCVFGAYVVSLLAALFESVGWYGPMRVFTTGYLSNMVLPFQGVIVVWIVASVLRLLGQLPIGGAKPHGSILWPALSLVSSIVLQLTVGASLVSQKVPWFVSYLGLTNETKVVIAIVSMLALGYIVYSPWAWRAKPRKEIADELKDILLNRILVDVEGYLERQHSKTDRSEIQTHDASFYVDMISIAVSALCTTPDAKRVGYYGRFSLPDLELIHYEIGPYREGHYRAGEDRGGGEIIRGRSPFYPTKRDEPLTESKPTEVLNDDFLRLVLERMKDALMDIVEFESYREKLKGFEPSAHIPDRVVMLENGEYDAEYRTLKQHLNQHPAVAHRDVDEKYPWGIAKSSQVDSKDTAGATFNIVNKETGRHMRVVLFRKPFTLYMLVYELLHIFEDYLSLRYGELATRCSQSIADRINIKVS